MVFIWFFLFLCSFELRSQEIEDVLKKIEAKIQYQKHYSFLSYKNLDDDLSAYFMTKGAIEAYEDCHSMIQKLVLEN